MKRLTTPLSFAFFFLAMHFASGQTVNNDSVYHAIGQTVNNDSVYHAIGPAVNNDSLILQYCKAHKLTPTRSASGLYYIIKKPGKGAAVRDSAKVSVGYTGSLLNGTVFDSNMKKKFHHKAPFEYKVGTGQLIKGFEEGDKLLHAGGSAILIIPPYLGYGDRDMKIIPPNSVLVFDVHIRAVNKL